jgi:hypothetical protein
MKTLVILLSCLSLQALAGTEGHGGDPLRLLFDDARTFAADRVLKAEACAFGSNVSTEIRDWVLNHKQALADDILQSPHTWITDKQSTCAFTKTNSRAEITFSFETCRPGIRDISDALKILVHESVHHFGVADEYFADKVSDAVYNLGSHSACEIPPSQNPFDPASCPGTPLSSQDLFRMIPLPEKNEIDLGRFEVSSRIRTCYAENWCTDWRDNNLPLFASIGGVKPDSQLAATAGLVNLKLKNNIPAIDFTSDPFRIVWNTSYPEGAMTNWLSSSTMEGYELKNTLAFPNSLSIRTGATDLKSTPLVGWVTRSCLRETVRGSYAAKDNYNNDVTMEYETVLLSHH